MLSARTRLFPSRLFTVLGLILLISTSTGCATRALMSSDRYEKPEQEPQQFHFRLLATRQLDAGAALSGDYQIR